MILNIKTLTVHAGHNPDGKVGSGAVKYIKESTEARNVLKELIPLVKKECTVYDTTCNNGTSQSDILNKIIDKCNSYNSNLNVSIHFNSGGGRGVEVLVYNLNDKETVEIASRVCKKITETYHAKGDKDFKNRGVKEKKTLAFLRRTKAKSILVECCFVDTDDTKNYNAKDMAINIFEGIFNKSVSGSSQDKKNKYTIVYEGEVDKAIANVMAINYKSDEVYVCELKNYVAGHCENLYVIGSASEKIKTSERFTKLQGDDRWVTLHKVLDFIGK
ncbi:MULTISPECIES: N-acetylmuramoyl-L-alanine amidase [unclassified Clostridioides]|uniref:N-acetylmuramoyl-L-alanine amidase n=1 Tax=unclassified Clostridioides TaxID=2635829 RepID=UPI001D0BF652